MGDLWECLLPLTGQWCPKIADLLLYHDGGSISGAVSIKAVSQGQGGQALPGLSAGKRPDSVARTERT